MDEEVKYEVSDGGYSPCPSISVSSNGRTCYLDRETYCYPDDCWLWLKYRGKCVFALFLPEPEPIIYINGEKR